ncbi:hypothetical protein AGMMS49942_17590 [Spirochaetia bacterium]|nr:hypothetical protein AGMMS49942_17590 [Spirochaetia bacterium]
MGVDGKTEGHWGGAFLAGLPGQLLLVRKLLPVPGAGGAGDPQAAAFLFRIRKMPGEIEGMGVSIGGHYRRRIRR